VAGTLAGRVLLGSAASPGEIAGRVELLGADKRKSAAEGAVVWLPGLPASAATASAPSSMASKEKRFEPHVIAVPAGTTVRFPNRDHIFHNAFSQTECRHMRRGPTTGQRPRGPRDTSLRSWPATRTR
jgi:plastocyanin